MEKEIIINSTNEDSRIALLEDKKLVEIFIERPDKERQVGDIYKGKVRKLVKGMQAAFIDIGFKQDAFLHFSDMGNNVGQLFADIDNDDLEDNGEVRSDMDPQDLLHNGQEIVVQITKEPIAHKGPRVSTEINIPGRFLVLLPKLRKVGVSRKIASHKERKRLRSLMRSLLPKDFGLIIRTVADGKDEEMLKQDLDKLVAEWHALEKKLESAPAFSLLYKDLSMASSVIRDLFTEDVKRVVVDSRKMFRELVDYLKDVNSGLHQRVEYYRSRKPIFDAFNVESEIQRSIEKKVWMDNGGYLFIEQTEALTVVDVNSGRYFGRKDHERNSLKINLEASREVARQLRLRDIGGLIVVDFIDMEQATNRKRLLNELNKEFARDRAVSKIEPMSRFGLVEMTRQRVRPSLIHNIYEHCPTCIGTGLVPTKGTIMSTVERALRRYTTSRLDRRVILQLHPTMLEYVDNKRFGRRFQLMWKYWIKIVAEVNEELMPHEFRLLEKRNRKDVTGEFAY